MIYNFNKFLIKKIYENDRFPQEKYYFNLSDKLINILEKIGDNKYSKILLDLKDGVSKEFLVDYPINFLDIEIDGMISFLKPRYFNEENKWVNNKRTLLKSTKIAKEIYKENYLNNILNQTDIEKFINILKSYTDNKSAFVVEYSGDELLRAYNYNGELSRNFGYSCANFKQSENNFGGHREPVINEYDVYTKNPDNCKVAVVWYNNEIVARKSFQQGIQLCDSGVFKKGELCTVKGRYYGIGGSESKYDIMINEYLKNKYKNIIEFSNRQTSLCINIETRWDDYPAFDSMYVSLEKNLLSNYPAGLPRPYYEYKWDSTYPSLLHLHCPKNLVQKRIEENK